jgi:hypothetical protein
MDLFVRKHQKKIYGTLRCFDRMLFRGYLPIQSGWIMADITRRKKTASGRGARAFNLLSRDDIQLAIRRRRGQGCVKKALSSNPAHV